MNFTFPSSSSSSSTLSLSILNLNLLSFFFSDLPLIRDAVSEKVGTFFFALSMFITGFTIAFVANWKIALVVLAGTPVLIVVVALVSKFLLVYSTAAQKLYAAAGSLAQEVQHKKT